MCSWWEKHRCCMFAMGPQMRKNMLDILFPLLGNKWQSIFQNGRPNEYLHIMAAMVDIMTILVSKHTLLKNKDNYYNTNIDLRLCL